MIKAFFEKLSKKEKILLFVSLGLISFALLDILLIGPILSRMHVMDAEIDAKKETIKRNLRIISFRDSIHAEYQSYQSYLDSADKSREEIIGDLLKKIEGVAKDHKIGIIKIQPGDIAENPVFQQYKTSLECEGAFSDLLAFMRDLEGSEFLFKITKYSIVPKSKAGEVLICTMDITRIFITVDKNDAAGTAAAAARPPAAQTPAAELTDTESSSVVIPVTAVPVAAPALPAAAAGDDGGSNTQAGDQPIVSQDFLP